MTINLDLMKFFTIIFVFYILALSLMPCSDIHNDCVKTENQKQISQNENHNHKSDHNDFCSPFCTCSCCNTLMTLDFFNTTFKLKHIIIESDNINAIQDYIFVSNFYLNIWQPPKIITDC